MMCASIRERREKEARLLKIIQACRRIFLVALSHGDGLFYQYALLRDPSQIGIFSNIFNAACERLPELAPRESLRSASSSINAVRNPSVLSSIHEGNDVDLSTDGVKLRMRLLSFEKFNDFMEETGLYDHPETAVNPLYVQCLWIHHTTDISDAHIDEPPVDRTANATSAFGTVLAPSMINCGLNRSVRASPEPFDKTASFLSDYLKGKSGIQRVSEVREVSVHSDNSHKAPLIQTSKSSDYVEFEEPTVYNTNIYTAHSTEYLKQYGTSSVERMDKCKMSALVGDFFDSLKIDITEQMFINILLSIVERAAGVERCLLESWDFIYHKFFKSLILSSCMSGTLTAIMSRMGKEATIGKRITQRVIFRLLQSHLNWLLLPIYRHYCYSELPNIAMNMKSFLRFCNDLQLSVIEKEVAIRIFYEANQHDTEGMLTGTVDETLELDEFVESLLLIAIYQFSNEDEYPTLITVQAKVYELFRHLRRRFGLCTVLQNNGEIPPNFCCSSYTLSKCRNYCFHFDSPTAVHHVINKAYNTNTSSEDISMDVKKHTFQIGIDNWLLDFEPPYSKAKSFHVLNKVHKRCDAMEKILCFGELSVLYDCHCTSLITRPPNGLYWDLTGDSCTLRNARLYRKLLPPGVSFKDSSSTAELERLLWMDTFESEIEQHNGNKPFVGIPPMLTLVHPPRICIDDISSFLICGIFLPIIENTSLVRESTGVTSFSGDSSCLKSQDGEIGNFSYYSTESVPITDQSFQSINTILARKENFFSIDTTKWESEELLRAGSILSSKSTQPKKNLNYEANIKNVFGEDTRQMRRRVAVATRNVITSVDREIKEHMDYQARHLPSLNIRSVIPCKKLNSHISLSSSGSCPSSKISCLHSSVSCPVSVVLGHHRPIIGRPIQVDRNRWKVTINVAEVDPCGFLPLVQVEERDDASLGPYSISSMRENVVPNSIFLTELSSSSLRPKKPAHHSAYSLRIRPSQCLVVRIESKDQSLWGNMYQLDVAAPWEHTITLELNNSVDHLTVHQSNWLIGLFKKHSDPVSKLLSYESFLSGVLSSFRHEQIIMGVPLTLVRTEPLTNLSDCTSDIQKLYRLFSTSRMESAAYMKINPKVELEIHHEGGTSRWIKKDSCSLPCTPKETVREGVVQLSSNADQSPTGIVFSDTPIQKDTDGNTTVITGADEVMEGISFTGFLLFLTYAILGRKSHEGPDQCHTNIVDAINNLIPTNETEEAIWMMANNIQRNSPATPQKLPVTVNQKSPLSETPISQLMPKIVSSDSCGVVLLSQTNLPKEELLTLPQITGIKRLSKPKIQKSGNGSGRGKRAAPTKSPASRRAIRKLQEPTFYNDTLPVILEPQQMVQLPEKMQEYMKAVEFRKRRIEISKDYGEISRDPYTRDYGDMRDISSNDSTLLCPIAGANTSRLKSDFNINKNELCTSVPPHRRLSHSNRHPPERREQCSTNEDQYTKVEKRVILRTAKELVEGHESMAGMIESVPLLPSMDL